MNIGFDLDRIFINTPPLVPNAVIEFFYRKKTNGILLYRIPSKKAQIIRRISHIPLLRPPIKKNLLILNTIPKEKHTLFLISSRFSFLRSATNNIVKNYKLDRIFRETHFNFDDKQPHIFKNEIISKLKLDMYIDDDLYLLKYIAGKNNKTKLFWLNSRINKKISSNITGITNLADIFKYL